MNPTDLYVDHYDFNAITLLEQLTVDQSIKFEHSCIIIESLLLRIPSPISYMYLTNNGYQQLTHSL